MTDNAEKAYLARRLLNVYRPRHVAHLTEKGNSMIFTHRITWHIGLNRKGVPYPPSEAIEAASDQLARRGIDGFTVVQGVGYWQGEAEECLIVSVMVDWDGFGSRAVADGIAHDLAYDLGQDAVAWAVDALAAGELAWRG